MSRSGPAGVVLAQHILSSIHLYRNKEGANLGECSSNLKTSFAVRNFLSHEFIVEGSYGAKKSTVVNNKNHPLFFLEHLYNFIMT